MITPQPGQLLIYAKVHLVEMIMALIGRASPNPKRYRELLEGMELQTLSNLLRTLEAQMFDSEIRIPQSAIDNAFPALSLTETAGVIASADKGPTVPGSSRGIFSKATTSKSVLV